MKKSLLGIVLGALAFALPAIAASPPVALASTLETTGAHIHPGLAAATADFHGASAASTGLGTKDTTVLAAARKKKVRQHWESPGTGISNDENRRPAIGVAWNKDSSESTEPIITAQADPPVTKLFA